MNDHLIAFQHFMAVCPGLRFVMNRFVGRFNSNSDSIAEKDHLINFDEEVFH